MHIYMYMVKQVNKQGNKLVVGTFVNFVYVL